ncbi:protein telomere ends associated isoform X4 [Drosophila kikkawai]|uniref:Protein telomere ends associated isoform X4 n=1 Tax=Drosophila kikkawai TaxID=30033 RepID=A0ABM4GDU3_DROKI
MSPPPKKPKMEDNRCSQKPVSFEQFKKIIENLPDICFNVQRDGVAGKGGKTLDECALWYYESFYKDPEVRKKYPYKLRACPMNIRTKLLSMPEPGPVGEPHQAAEGVLVKVARMGTFTFPVTFFAFRSSVNTEEVLRLTGIAKEERKTMLGNEKQCEVVLKKFYHSFYMFPDRQSTAFFKDDISLPFKQQLLKHGEPYDELAKNSVEKHATGNKRKSVVSYKVFAKYLENMHDIVWQLKMHEKRYIPLDFDKCTYALYLEFYLKPEIRESYTFKWRPCNLTTHKHLLSIPNKEYAQELRRTLPVQMPDFPKEEESTDVADADTPVQARDESISAVDVLRKSLKKPSRMPEPELKVKDEVIELSDDSEAATPPVLQQMKTLDQAVKEVSSPKKGQPSAADVLRKLTEKNNNSLETPTRINQSELEVEDEVVDIDVHSQAAYTMEKTPVLQGVKNVSPPKKGQPSAADVLRKLTEKNNNSLETPTRINQSELEVEDEVVDIDVHSQAAYTMEKTPVLRGVKNVSPPKKGQPSAADVLRKLTEENNNSLETPTRMHQAELEVEDEVVDIDVHSQAAYTMEKTPVLRGVKNVSPPKKGQPSATDVLRKLTEKNNNSLETPTRMHQAELEVEDEIIVDDMQNTPILHTDVEVNIGSHGRFMFPVSFETFRGCINYDEIIRPILKLKIKDKSQLANLILHPRNPICEKIFRRYYRSFYIFPDYRLKFEYRFSCPDKRVLKKLTEYAKPLNESAQKTMNQDKTMDQEVTNVAPAEQRKHNPAEEPETATVSAQKDNREVESIKDKEISEKAKKLSKLPVPFSVFKRYLRNIDEITQQMKLCDEYKEKSDTECAEEYYKEFYTSPEMRNKFEYKLRPCPAKMRDTLLAYAQQPKPEHSSSQGSDCVCLDDVPQTSTKEDTPSEELKNDPVKKSKAKESHENHVSFTLFKRYLSNLPEIVQQMLLCDDQRGKSEKECARDYYNAFYTSQEMRDRYPYKLKPCPGQMKNKLLSFPKKAHQIEEVSPEKQSEPCASICSSSDKFADNIIVTETNEVEVDSGEIPVETPNNFQQTEAILKQKSRKTSSNARRQKTFPNGASFEFPVSIDTFKRHINCDEIIKSLRVAYGQNETDQRDRDKELFHQFYCSFYVQKEVRQRHSYKFQNTDEELLEKLEEYAVPLNDMARQTISSVEAQGKENEKSGMAPPAPKDETLITISGIAYRFPVSFKTFQKYINYEDLKVGLANGLAKKKKSPEQVAEILGDEGSCLRLLRRYYLSFYTLANIRNKLEYNFNAAPLELSDKLLEWAKPINETTVPTGSVPQTKQGVPSAHSTPNLDAIREAELVNKIKNNIVTYRPHDLRKYISSRVASPTKQAALERDIVGSIQMEIPELVEQQPTSDKNIEAKTTSEKNIGGKTTSGKNIEAKTTSEKNIGAKTTSGKNIEGKTTSEKEKATSEKNMEAKKSSEKNIEGKKTSEKNIGVKATSEKNIGVKTTSEKNIGAKTASEKNIKEKTISEKNIEAKTTSEKNIEAKTTSGKNIEGKTTSEKTIKEKATTEKNIEAKTTSEKNIGAKTASEKTIIEKAISEKNIEANSTKKSESSSEITRPVSSNNKKVTKQPEENQNKENAKSQDGTGTSDSTAAKTQSMLEEAKKQFFAESSKDHKMAYLICTSQGLKRSIWRILYQLTLEEFKTYTSIHNGEDFYRKDEDLHPYYEHVVDKGNWPLNLYVRLPLLRQLLHSKGVHLGRLDLGQLSPKMIHWVEAEHTDFDKIVEMQFKERTGEEIDSVEQWFQEREDFYEACWLRDHWIYKVPQITNDDLQDESYVRDLPLPDFNGIVIKSLATAKSGDESSQTEILSISSSPDMVPDSQSCPSTQLSNTSNFVDIGSVDMQSQVPDTPLDPLASQTETLASQTETLASQTETLASQTETLASQTETLASQTETLASVKQEPINFLNNMRGICDTNGCEWENIGLEEQIINLDSSQEEGSSLSCFAIPKPSETISSFQSLDSLLTATMFEDENSIEEEESQPKTSNNIQNLPEQPVEPAVKPEPSSTVAETNVIQPQVQPADNRKKKLPASNEVPSKRVRLMNDKVPQLRHEFRPLPLNACVRIETEIVGTNETTPTEQPHINPTPQPEVVPNTITPSQEFAQDNTLLASSQLAPLLDTVPPGVTVRKVNQKDQVGKNLSKVQKPTLRQTAIFRKLERFYFFASLTVQQIIQYRIEGHLQGATYQSAMLKIDGKCSLVRGPLLKILFPHLSPQLRSDLQQVLADMPEFVYSCRWRRVQKDPTEDLRKRVLFTFMDMAPEFGQFRLLFDTDSREWATCSEIGRWHAAERAETRPTDFEKVISPGILEKMREYKALMS